MKKPVKKNKNRDLENFMEHFAKISGVRFQKVENGNGEVNMNLVVPICANSIGAMLAAIPAALIAQQIELMTKLGEIQKTIPPNDTFEGKKRF